MIQFKFVYLFTVFIYLQCPQLAQIKKNQKSCRLPTQMSAVASLDFYAFIVSAPL